MQKTYRTRCRDSIMSYLKNNQESSFSAYDVHAYLQSEDIQVNLTTIYRNLDKLMENGILMRHKTAGDECCKYQYVKPHGNCQDHIHMKCRKCGKIFHLECSFMKEISMHLQKEHKFTLECNGSILVGLCELCVNVHTQA